MKRRLVTLMVLPLLASCGIYDDYYTNDYRRPSPPVARVYVPNPPPNFDDRAASVTGNTHHHDESSVAVRAPARPAPRMDNEANVMQQYDDYHAHGHD